MPLSTKQIVIYLGISILVMTAMALVFGARCPLREGLSSSSPSGSQTIPGQSPTTLQKGELTIGSGNAAMPSGQATCQPGSTWSSVQQECIASGAGLDGGGSTATALGKALYGGLGDQYGVTHASGEGGGSGSTTMGLIGDNGSGTVMAGGASTLRGGGTGVCLSITPSLNKIGDWGAPVGGEVANVQHAGDLSGIDISGADISGVWGGGLAEVPPLPFRTPPAGTSAQAYYGAWGTGQGGTSGVDSYGMPESGTGSVSGGTGTSSSNPNNPIDSQDATEPGVASVSGGGQQAALWDSDRTAGVGTVKQPAGGTVQTATEGGVGTLGGVGPGGHVNTGISIMPMTEKSSAWQEAYNVARDAYFKTLTGCGTHHGFHRCTVQADQYMTEHPPAIAAPAPATAPATAPGPAPATVPAASTGGTQSSS